MARDLLSEALTGDDFEDNEEFESIRNAKSKEDLDKILEDLEKSAESEEPDAKGTSSGSVTEDPEKDTPKEKDTSIVPEKTEPEKKTEEEPAAKAEDGEKPVIKDEIKKEDEPVATDTSPTGIDLTQIITEGVIKQFDEKDHGILRKYIDKPLKEGFNALIHSQRKIGERNILNQGKEAKIYAPVTQPIKTEAPQDIRGISDVVKLEISNRLKAVSKYRDMPDEGTDEYNDWVSDLKEDQEAYYDFRKAKEQTESIVNKQIEDIQYVATNSSELNKKAMEQNAEIITKQLLKMGIEDPKELGYDFEVRFDENGFPFNDALNELLDDGRGGVDKNLMNYEYGVPIIRGNELAKKFILEKSPEIIRKITEAGVKKKAQELDDLKQQLPKSIVATSQNTKESEKVSVNEMTNAKQVAAYMDDLENSILEK